MSNFVNSNRYGHKAKLKINTLDIFGVDFAVTDYNLATELIVTKAIERQYFKVYALPVTGVYEAHRDPEFKAATDCADLIVPDGQPIRWVMNYFYRAALKDRVYGPKLTNQVLGQADIQKLRIFLYGGSTTKVLSGFKKYIETNFPNICVCGSYREERFGEETLDIEELKKLEPNLILVGLGCPTQEKWIANNKIEAVAMGVGAAFSFYSGETKMAPQWMQNAGLEWFYRLLKEPKRLWRRYFITNTYFIALVSRLWLSRLAGK